MRMHNVEFKNGFTIWIAMVALDVDGVINFLVAFSSDSVSDAFDIKQST